MKTTKHSFFVNGLCALAFGLCAQVAFSQAVSIGTTNTAPDPSAMLEMVSTTKGALIPRMTSAQRLAIAAPATGLLVYQNAAAGNFPMGFYYWSGVAWIFLGLENSGKVQQPTTVSDNSFPISASSTAVGITTLSWAPAYTVAPTVLASPEYTVVGSAPPMSAYCIPTGTCGPGARLGIFRGYYPANNPTIPAHQRLSLTANAFSCATHYTYVAQPPTGTNINTLFVDFCPAAPNPLYNYGAIDFAFRGTGPGNTAIKAFTFWIDTNQDGDFDDPGEMVTQRPCGIANLGTDYWTFSTLPAYGAGSYPPVPINPAITAEGITKMRVIVHNTTPGAVIDNPCFGSTVSITHDFDVDIQCTGIAPLFPSDVNVCNVDLVTTNSARVSCFDKDGTPANLKFHYKIIRHD